MNWFLDRLKEPSSYRGLVWLLTALGVSLSPEAWQYITTIGMAAAGLIGVLTHDAPPVPLLPPIELVSRPAAGAEPVGMRQPAMRTRHNTNEAADLDPQRSGFNG